MWRGEHIGPTGTRFGTVFGDWGSVAEWLRAMMQMWRPEEGVDAALLRLRGAPAGEPFVAQAGEHRFEIREDGQVIGEDG